jgi:hypothetical protein
VTKTNAQPNYAALVAEAEKAVSAVKDPELKQAAFVKVLDTLLSEASEHSSDHDEQDAPTKKYRAAAKKSESRPAKRSGGTKGYIEELLGEGFFKTQRTIGAVKTELGNRGHHIPLTGLSTPLQRLCQQRMLRREKKAEGNKTVFAYSKW